MRPLGLLLILVWIALPVRAGDDRPERRVSDPKLQASVNRAIDQGVAYLKSRQEDNGAWYYNGAKGDTSGGMTALALYALSASGVGYNAPAIQRGLEWTRGNPKPFGLQASHGTYSASLLVMALTRISARIHRERIFELADRIAASQCSSNMWSYRLTGNVPDRSPGEEEKQRTKRRTKRKMKERPSHLQGDNSNSQFAILAMWAAQNLAGWETPERTWRRVREFYRLTQNNDGGWSYSGGPDMGGSLTMTAAGLVSHVYADAGLHGGSVALPLVRGDPVAQDGLAAFRRLVRSDFYNNYYAVYSVERVGTVLDLPTRDWYEPGARELVRRQEADGSWQLSTYNTCLALLFLSRATRSTITPRAAATTDGGERFPDVTGDGQLARAFDFYVAFNPRRRAEVIREFGKAGPAAVGLFVQKLSDRRELVRATAFELLSRLVDRAFFFDPAAALHQREVMLRPITAYWKSEGAHLRWDAKRGKFVR